MSAVRLDLVTNKDDLVKRLEGLQDTSIRVLRGDSVARNGFDVPRYDAALRSSTCGRTLLLADRLPSTQDWLRSHAGHLPDGALLVARTQTAGKGRGRNTWESPAGCVVFSVLCRARQLGERAPFLNYVVCLAVSRAIQQLAQQALQGQHLEQLRIKWPNDVYCGAQKICGALINSTYNAGTFHIVVGVGINLDNTQPTTCLNVEIAKEHERLQLPGSCQKATWEELAALVMNELDACMQVFLAHGFQPLQEEYLAAWMHSGQRVQLRGPASRTADVGPADTSPAPQRTGMGDQHPAQLSPESYPTQRTADSRSEELAMVIQGLSPSGFLLAHDVQGCAYELTPDGNSLDMMQGLIQRKLYS